MYLNMSHLSITGTHFMMDHLLLRVYRTMAIFLLEPLKTLSPDMLINRYNAMLYFCLCCNLWLQSIPTNRSF